MSPPQPAPRFRAILLSKAFVVGAYQRKAELMAEALDLALGVLTPPRWRDGKLERRLERAHERGYILVETPIFLAGNFHLHLYPRLGRDLDRLLGFLRDSVAMPAQSPGLLLDPAAMPAQTRALKSLAREPSSPTFAREASSPSLVHIDEEAYNLSAWLAFRAARRRDARTLFFSWQNLPRRYPPPFGWFERSVHRGVDGAIAGSQTAAQVLRDKGYAGPLWVIPQFGVDELQFRPPDPDPRRGQAPSSGRPARPLVIGYAGRLVPSKGLDLLLTALASQDAQVAEDAEDAQVAQVAKPERGAGVEMAEHPKKVGIQAGGSGGWRLEIVGQGEARAAIQAQAERLGIASRIRIRDWLPSAEMPDFYRQIDILVLPSRSTPHWIEQFGRVLIEAMASGAVVVGSDSGEIPHVIGQAGLVFAEDDAAALAAALARLAGDAALRDRLAKAGRERVLAEFTMRRVAEATVAVYREIIGGEVDSGAIPRFP